MTAKMACKKSTLNISREFLLNLFINSSAKLTVGNFEDQVSLMEEIREALVATGVATIVAVVVTEDFSASL